MVRAKLAAAAEPPFTPFTPTHTPDDEIPKTNCWAVTVATDTIDASKKGQVKSREDNDVLSLLGRER